MARYFCPLCHRTYAVEEKENLRFVLCGDCHIRLLYYKPVPEEMIN